MKRIFLFAVIMALALSLTACGEVTKETVIEDCLDFISDIDNVHCATVTGMDIQIGENHNTNSLIMDADMDIENRFNHVTMVSSSNDEEIAVEFYVDANSSPAQYYLGSGERWVKMDPESIPDVDVSPNIHRDFEAHFDELMINPSTTMEVVDVDGIECYMLHAPITVRSLTMAKNFSIDGFITGVLGEDASDNTINTVISYLGPIDLTVYVNCDDYSPVGMVVDLKTSLENLYNKLGVTDVTINEAYASSAYSEHNDSEVEIPEKVRFAPDVSSISGSTK